MEASKQPPPTPETADSTLSHYAKTLRPGKSIQIPLDQGNIYHKIGQY